MNVIAQLSLSQLKNNKKDTFWAARGHPFSDGALTCVCDLAVSGYEMLISFSAGIQRFPLPISSAWSPRRS